MPEITSEKLSKLPAWAQQHITDIRRQRDVAIRELNKHLDNQTPAAFYVDDLICTGEEHSPSSKRRYIGTRKMTVKHAGVLLDILLRDDHIDLSWGSPDGMMREIALIPSSNQQARLVSKGNMR